MMDDLVGKNACRASRVVSFARLRFALAVFAVLLLLSLGCAAASADQPLPTARAMHSALELAKRHHGLPSGAHVPAWVRDPQHDDAYLLPPAPGKLKLSAETQLGEGPPEPHEPIGPNGQEGGWERPKQHNDLGLRCTGWYCPQPPIRWQGGPVQQNPVVHVIFWGSNWNVSPGTTAKAALLNFFEGLSGSRYQEVMTQYFDGTGRISATVKVDSWVDTHVTAPKNVNDATAEVAYAIEHNPTWKREPNAQYAVFPAPGTTYMEGFTGFCAYHGYDEQGTVYLMVPYAGDEPFKEEDGCEGYYGKGDPAKATSLMASHEYSEAITDPFWNVEPGWYDTEGYENGDLCATPYDELPNGAFVQGTYDDHQNACSLEDKEPPHVLGITEQATNVTEHGAHLHGTINPEGSATTYQFEYGTTTAYGSKVPAEGVSVGSGRGNIPVEAVLTGLTREQVYHYRVIATNSTGTTYGEDQTLYPSRWFDRKAPQGPQWTSDGLGGVSCTSSEFCMAVGNKRDLAFNEVAEVNRNLAYELHNGEWIEREPPQEASDAWPGLNGVSCTAPTFCMAVGQAVNYPAEQTTYATAERWNGKEWSILKVPVPAGTKESQFNSVSCPSATECFAVGHIVNSANEPENLAAVWKGGTWSLQAVPTQESTGWDNLEAVSCPSATFCIASGYYSLKTGSGSSRPTILKWNGENWTFQSPSQTLAALWDVSCSSSSSCAAVNLFGDTEIWNGTAWETKTAASTPDVNGYGLEGVSCSSSTSCVATGYGLSKGNGAAVSLSEEWNGSSWVEQTTPRESERFANALAAVSCSGTSSCVAVGTTFAPGRGQALIETRQAPVTPTRSTTIGASGSGSGQFSFPRGIAVDSAGNFWVADSGNNRIEKFTSKGEFVQSVGKGGTANGQFNTPVDIAIDGEGNLYVTDALNSRVQKFNSKGEWLSTIGKNGFGLGEFIEPSGIAIDPATGNIWISDHRNSNVQEFNSKGEFVRRSPVEFAGPEGMAVDSEGHVFVVDAPANQVVELSSTGAFMRQFGVYGLGDGQFAEPNPIEIKSSGELLVPDRETGRVQEFSPSGEYLCQFGPLVEPDGIAVSAGGVIYVSNSRENRVERWMEGPMAITNEAQSVSMNQATLNGTINPGGTVTTYQFEYGTTTGYGSTAPSPAKEAGSGTSEVQVSTELTGLQEQTTYHYRIVAKNSNATSYGKDRTFTTGTGVPGQLKSMAVTDPFNGTTSAVSNFGSNWSGLGWAGGSPAKGEDSASGWHPTATWPTVNGASFNPSVADLGTGTAAVATMATNPSLESRYFSLWLDMPTPGSTRAGYELRFTDTSANKYTVALSRWKEGTQTVLASQTGFSFANGNSFAVADQGSTVSAWVNTGSGFSQLLSASDSTFSGGNAAVEGSGNITRLTSFKVGTLVNGVSNMDSALKTLPVRDQFSGSESPLSEGGTWASLAWDNSGSGHNTGQVSGGWGPYDAYSTINGASWQKATFADTGSGDAVSATLTTSPGSTSRYFSLWLDMPSPGSTRSGYELRFTETAAGVYEVVESKWVSGTKTTLATKTGYSFATGRQLALVDKGGTVSTWMNSGAEYVQLLSASDSTFTNGNIGIEGSGSNTRLTELKGGPLAPF